jgi:hypothetical protein
MFEPVFTKPLSSSFTPDRDNHAVFGSAPMNKNRWRIARLTSSPDRWERQVAEVKFLTWTDDNLLR